MTVRVYQVPSPMFGVGHPAPYVALVHHRMVGTLKSTDLVFSRQPGVGRSASTTFGIGTCTRGHPENPCIHQYVRLGDQHWGNGNWDPTGVWDDWYPTTHINSRTISTEHEDNGGAPVGSGRGVITEAIWARSIELDRLLLSGDVAAMKAAGITFRAGLETVIGRELAAIVPSTKTILKHNDIAGKLKPFCLSPWSDDKVGFPRERFILELSTPEEPEVDAFNIPDRDQLLTLPVGTVIYVNSDLAVNPGNVTISPGRDFPLVGVFPSGSRIVAYKPSGASVPHSYFTKANVGTIKDAPGPVLPVPNCDPAVKTAVNAALQGVLTQDFASFQADVAARKIA